MNGLEVLTKEPPKSIDGKDHLPAVRARFQAEWASVTEKVDWDADAALALIGFLLPLSGEYLRQGKAYHPQPIQGIGHKRYWDRGVNQYVDLNHERDQILMADINGWLDELKPRLVTELAKGSDYVKVFDHFAATYFMQSPQAALDLASAVFDELRKSPDTLMESDAPPAAFTALWRLASGWIEPSSEEVGRTWLGVQITASVSVSLAFTNEIYLHWLASSALTRPETKREIRRHTMSAARGLWRTVDDLLRVLHRKNPYDVYRFVFPPTEQEYSGYFYDPGEFAWLGKLLVEALETEPELVARKIAHLIALRLDGTRPAEWIYQTDHEKLFAIFTNDSWRVLEAVSRLADKAEGPDKHVFTQIAQSGFSEFWNSCGLVEGGPTPK